MNEKKLRTVKPTPLRGKLKDRDIRRAVLAVKAAREAGEKKAASGSR
jgi:hypothetical protein